MALILVYNLINMAKAKYNNTQEEKSILTKEGYDKLLEELNDRKKVKRVEIANNLEKATEQGDLSENSAYKQALEEKELNEAKIEELEATLANSKVIKEDSPSSVAGLGDKVTLEAIPQGDKITYTLVGKSETDPKEGLISIESPVGKAVYGKSVGDEVEVNLPLQTMKYKLKKIN
jgi:transcription elongation factor GreA